MTYLVGGSAPWIAVGMLVAIGLILTLSPVVYRAVEGTQFLKVFAVGLLVVVAGVFAVPESVWVRTPALLSAVDIPAASMGWPLLLGALAYAGAGGGQNLCQSNYIRDKGYGMGIHAPRVVSPLTGEPVADVGTGWRFETDETALTRWRGWWRIANIEQLSTFVAISLITITFTSILAYATLSGRTDLPRDISFLAIEGAALSDRVGIWFGRLFWAVGAFSLFAAALGIVDYTSRLAADVLRTSYLPGKSESIIYAGIVWAMVLTGTAIIVSGLSQPLVLLVLAGCIAAFMMFLYSGLLIVLNRKLLAPPLRPSLLRTATLVWAVGLFGILSAITVVDQTRKLFP